MQSRPRLAIHEATEVSLGKEELSQRRRWVLKGLGLIAAGAALAPYVPFGGFLQKASAAEEPEIRVGNVEDADLTAPGSMKLIAYPRPAEEDPFSSGLVLHLFPEDAEIVGTEFMAFNRTCVHLRCLYNYNPDRNQHECPCHGSIYRSYDGVPIGGPSFLLKLKPEPEVVLKINENGDIFAVSLNGVIGIGRDGGWTKETLITPKKYPYMRV